MAHPDYVSALVGALGEDGLGGEELEKRAAAVERLLWGGFLRGKKIVRLTSKGKAALERRAGLRATRAEWRKALKEAEPPPALVLLEEAPVPPPPAEEAPRPGAKKTLAELALELLALESLPQQDLCGKLHPAQDSSVRGVLVKLERAGKIERYTAPVKQGKRSYDATWWRLVVPTEGAAAPPAEEAEPAAEASAPLEDAPAGEVAPGSPGAADLSSEAVQPPGLTLDQVREVVAAYGLCLHPTRAWREPEAWDVSDVAGSKGGGRRYGTLCPGEEEGSWEWCAVGMLGESICTPEHLSEALEAIGARSLADLEAERNRPLRRGERRLGLIAAEHGWRLLPGKDDDELLIAPERGKKAVGWLEFKDDLLTAIELRAPWCTQGHSCLRGVKASKVEAILRQAQEERAAHAARLKSAKAVPAPPVAVPSPQPAFDLLGQLRAMLAAVGLTRRAEL